MKRNVLNLLTIAVCFCAVSSCSSSKFNGAFKGTLSAEIQHLGYGKTVTNTTYEKEENLTVILKQEGDEVLITILNSEQLGNCDLRAKISRNGSAYIDNPQFCSASEALTGSLNTGSGQMSFTLRSYSEYSNRTFQFTGFGK